MAAFGWRPVDEPSAKDKDLAFGLYGTSIFTSNKIYEMVENSHDEDYAEITPFVTVVVAICCIDVVVSIHIHATGNSTNGVASYINHGSICVVGDIGGAQKLAVVKLIDHKCLITIGYRVQIINPSTPGQHVVDWDNKSSEDK